jgi:hypothetical protein
MQFAYTCMHATVYVAAQIKQMCHVFAVLATECHPGKGSFVRIAAPILGFLFRNAKVV